MTAMIRNLATMTRVGIVAPGSAGAATVLERLADVERLRRARVHPIAVLSALRTYQAGRGARSDHRWDPVGQVVDAPGLTPRDASAAMALVTAASEPRHEVVGFHAGEGCVSFGRGHTWPGCEDGLTPLAISPRQRLDDAIGTVSDLPFGGTDCALPMLYAIEREREVDAFVVYTNSETWAGEVHPAQALRAYRERSGIDARLIVVGMVSNRFTIADPGDPGMLDVVGFDTATLVVVADFAGGSL